MDKAQGSNECGNLSAEEGIGDCGQCCTTGLIFTPDHSNIWKLLYSREEGEIEEI